MAPADMEETARIASSLGVEAIAIGETKGAALSVRMNGTSCFEIPVERLHETWDTAFERLVEA